MIPHYPDMVARLLDEPYLLSMESISNLTARQIAGLYFRPRDEKGNAFPLPYAFESKESAREKTIQTIMAISGISEEEARRIVSNGD